MIFSELYGAYYNAVAKILSAAVDHPLGKNELRGTISENAFGESVLNIEPAFDEERWQLLRTDGTTILNSAPSMPMTLLEKRWLKSISLDPRIRLFADSFPELDGVEPLFTPDDYCIFDKYSDGDPYENEEYIKNFRLILDAIKNKYPLVIETLNRTGNTLVFKIMPEYLEYSEKDDKFRLFTSGNRAGSTINLGRIVKCRRYNGTVKTSGGTRKKNKTERVEIEVRDERNALERVLLHFAHFEKEAEKAENGRYIVRIKYDKDDETELVIRILSFGPMVKVTSPQKFIELIKQRLIDQKSCEL